MTIHGAPGTVDVVVRARRSLGRGPGAYPAGTRRAGGEAGFRRRRICRRLLPRYHRDTESFAFCFERPSRRHLLPDRLATLGVPDGPMRKELADGRG
jgi:ribonuclease Z